MHKMITSNMRNILETVCELCLSICLHGNTCSFELIYKKRFLYKPYTYFTFFTCICVDGLSVSLKLPVLYSARLVSINCSLIILKSFSTKSVVCSFQLTTIFIIWLIDSVLLLVQSFVFLVLQHGLYTNSSILGL